MTNATSLTITATVGTSSRTVTTSAAAAGTVNDSPTQNTTYTAVATSASGGSATKTVMVQVGPAVAPQITSFTADPTTVNAGQSTTLTWQTTNATSIAISPAPQQSDDAGALSTSGSVSTPVSQTTTFTLTATGPGGTATQSVTVTVPITLSFTVSPLTITAGQQVTLSWQVTGGTASSLSIDNGVCSSCTLPQGTATASPSATTTYTATATAADGTQVTQTATVTVTAATPGVLKHIFVMLQENRSFDMYLGQLGAYRANRLAQAGIADSQTVNGFDPTVTLTNSNTGAQVQPFHESTVCTENLSPSWDESHHDVALTGGDAAWTTTTTYTNSSFAMNNFLDTTGSVTQTYDADGTRALGYYNQTDLPYYYDLATFFATSDDWHSPILANTIPNRMYLMAGTSFGHEYPDSTGHPLYSAETIFRAMNDANVSWLYYYKDGVFLANFADWSDPKIQTKVFPISDLFNRLSGTCSGAPCDPDKALPEVVFIDGASGSSHLDEHPGNNVQSGAAYVESIITALMNSDAWNDSAFILTYDEGGGLYDHVPPVTVPPPDNYAPGQCPDPNNGTAQYCVTGTIGGTFNLTGFRVPLIVISPYAKPHYVSHTPLGYTDILAFIEKTFNVPSLTQRDAYWLQQGDMSEFFDFSSPNLLTAPGGVAWPQYIATQPTTGLCDPTKESSTFAASP
jgi:phospholipase C